QSVIPAQAGIHAFEFLDSRFRGNDETGIDQSFLKILTSRCGAVMRRGIIRDTAVVSAMTLLSRILGFARDLILARVFGAGGDMDAFFVAFKIPNFLRRLFAEGAFSLAFVPVIGEYRARRDHADVRELTRRVAGTL